MTKLEQAHKLIDELDREETEDIYKRVKVEVDRGYYNALEKHTVMTCKSFDCIHFYRNFATCMRKEVNVGDEGKCKHYNNEE